MTENIKIPRGDALFLLDEDDDVNGYAYVATKDAGSGRWESHHILIIRRIADGALFGSRYSLGLTENQSHTYWGSDSHDPADGHEFAEFFPLVARQKVVTEYVKPGPNDADPAEVEWARTLVEDAAEEIDFMGVGERFEDAWADLSVEEFDARRERVYDLATKKAVVTVTFPDAGEAGTR